MGIFQQMLRLGSQILAKLDDVDSTMHGIATIMGTIVIQLEKNNAQLKQVNENLLVLIKEEAPDDIASFGVETSKPVKQQ